jgi:23S rRNA (adenine1618-N6)-methyltransferase
MQSKQHKPGNKATTAEKLHLRNRHRGSYDFARLLQKDAALTSFVRVNEHAAQSIDFANAAAVKALNRALLLDAYDIQGWDIPPDSLCPPIPGRADYIHYLADLLAISNGGVIPKGENIQVLDIGTGSSCIYPLLGHNEYGWQFIATDINADALANAQKILDANPALKKNITLRLQTNPRALFNGIIQDDEWYDLTLCNPPFHATTDEASASTLRKLRNLEKGKHPGKQIRNSNMSPDLNFGGLQNELCCEGGEAGFILRMIIDSKQFSTRCYWFTTLVSKSASLPGIYAALDDAGVQQHQTIAMSQGQKQSRFVAWTFLNPAQQNGWRKLRWGQ